MTTIPRIVITSGEPAGIGPDLILQIIQQDYPAELVVIGSKDLFAQRAKQLALPVQLHLWSEQQPRQAQQAGVLKLIDVDLEVPCVAGELNIDNAAYVIAMLKLAQQMTQNKIFEAVVTAPVHKAVINQAGLPFQGHTEFFAEQSQTPHVVMMLATQTLRVALVTTHIPLAQVAQAITTEQLQRCIRILHAALQNTFGIASPKIFVCGLNPHAGEDGHIGREEIDTIIPCLENLRKEKINLTGPLPADTVFTEKYIAQADAILAMYHDQGLPTLKHQGFGKAVNITLGLPFIRTSVDHGTACDLAGSGLAHSSSLQAAINLAHQLALKKYQGS